MGRYVRTYVLFQCLLVKCIIEMYLPFRELVLIEGHLATLNFICLTAISVLDSIQRVSYTASHTSCV